MPDFSKLRKGAEAVQKAQTRAKSGGFSPFVPEIFWQKDGDERYLLFLTPMLEVVTVDMINMIPTKYKVGDETRTRWERVIARTDPLVGEDVDPIHKEWDYRIQDMSLGVAVELEPTFEEVRGRQRPVGFEIKVNEYTRRVRDKDSGDLTDETEDVLVPAVGFVCQSPHNFYNAITAFDSKEGPIEEVPMRVDQIGAGTDKTFSANPFHDMDVDRGPLLEYIEGLSYLTPEEMKALVAKVDATEDDLEASLIIGEALLNKRLVELCDSDRYNRIAGEITEKSKYPASKKGKGGKKDEKKERPARQSSRRRPRGNDDDPAPGGSDNAVDAASEADAPAEEPKADKPARRSRSTAAKTEDKQSDPKAMSNLDRLRQRAAKKDEKATA